MPNHKTYIDFDLLIERVGDKYRARVLNSPAGPASYEFKMPFSDDKLENFILRISQGRRRVRNLRHADVDVSREFGTALFNAVFEDEVELSLRNSIAAMDSNTQSLRLRLRLTDAPELVDIPWEYLYDAANRRFLALSVDTPLVRYLDLSGRITPLAVQPPLNVLVVISSPTDVVELDVEDEWQRLKGAVTNLEKQGLIRLDRLEKATLDELQQSLRRNEYHVFHFIGHGGFNPTTNDGVLMMEDEQGRGRAVAGTTLGMLLHDEKTLRLAVLNACEGGRTSKTDPFAGVGQSLLQQGVPAVIAMQFEVTDESAIALASSFYAALTDGYPVEAALTEARKTIFARNELEWGTPVLYMRAPDGHIFDVAPIDPTVKSAVELEADGQMVQKEHQDVMVSPVAATPSIERKTESQSMPKKSLSMGLIAGIICTLVVLGGIALIISNLLSQTNDVKLTSQVEVGTQIDENPTTVDETLPNAGAPDTDVDDSNLSPEAPMENAVAETGTPTIDIPAADPNALFALAPDLEFSLFTERAIFESVIRKLNPLERVTVLKIDEEWAHVKTNVGETGWIRARFYTYEGNGSRLPNELSNRLISARDDLPFVHAEVVSYGGADGDFLLRNPHNELSGYRWIPVGTSVTVLQIGDGVQTYESGRWCSVTLVDPENSSQILNGWLPLDVLAEKESPYQGE